LTTVSLRSTLEALVAMDTTSTRPNAPAIDYLAKRLHAAGFELEHFRYTDDAGTEKVNLLAKKGGAGVPALALVGHTDCVPYDAQWKEALTLTERDGNLYGRGACDTKAFIACALSVAERVTSLKEPLLVLFTADEEIGCVGAKRLVDAKKGQARFAIVGEPTTLTPIRAHKGYCLAEVEVKGREGHSAFPHVGASAIFRAGRFLARLEEISRTTLREDVDVRFEPPYTTVNVGVISGGKAKNIIPGSCRFVVEWRPIPRQPISHVRTVLEDIVAGLRRAEPDVEVDIKFLRGDTGVDTAEGSRVVRFLEEQSGRRSETIPFGTEAPQLTALGAEAVVFGPGDIRVAHRTGEYVPIVELERCERILEKAVREFCGAELQSS
jgi:acetylornithine deacetylase